MTPPPSSAVPPPPPPSVYTISGHHKGKRGDGRMKGGRGERVSVREEKEGRESYRRQRKKEEIWCKKRKKM